MKGRPAAKLTWCSGKTLDWAGRVFGFSAHGHPLDVPRRSCLARLYHRPHWSLGNHRRVAGLLGAGRLSRWIDVDGGCVGLHSLDGIVRLPRAGWQRWDNERDVDSGPGGIWQRSRTRFSLEKRNQDRFKDKELWGTLTAPYGQ